MHNVRKLKIWHKALEIAGKIYEITDRFPKTEVYGLCQQMQRAAVSVGSNIAEGAGRNSRKEFIHFLGISNGSASELVFQVEFAHARKYIDENTCSRMIEELEYYLKMNYNLRKKLRADIS
jgi:four helix bundle protein